MQEPGPDMTGFPSQDKTRQDKQEALSGPALVFALLEIQEASSVPLLLAMRVRSRLTVTHQFNT
jgi:hypothetical protein